MSIAPRPSPAPAGPRHRRADEPPRPRNAFTASGIRRRRLLVTWTKRLLPLAALGLLGAVALWPELDHEAEVGRVTFRRMSTTDAGAAQLVDPRYRSVDIRGRPFTVTADTGAQAGAERIDLTNPKGDATLENGAWMMVQAKHGVFMQRQGQLDLSGDATLYRADGTTMVSDASTLDLKSGAATSSDRTHAEGPFGTLDAQGFTLVDKGNVIQFSGPAHTQLNGGQAAPLAAAPAAAPAPAPLAEPPQARLAHPAKRR